MDGLCGTSSSWLFPVPALEPKYNKSGKLRRIKPDLAKFCPVWRENPKSAWNTSNCRCLLRRGDISSATALEHRDLHQWDGGKRSISFESDSLLRLLFAVGHLTLADIPNGIPMLNSIVVPTHSPRVVRSLQGFAAKLLRRGRRGVLS